MIKNYDQSVEINRNPNWPYIPYHPDRILIVGGAGSVKTNILLNLIKHQRPDIDKIYLFVKDPFEWKYQFLINGREIVRIEILKNPKPFIDYSQTIDDVYENLTLSNPQDIQFDFKRFNFVTLMVVLKHLKRIFSICYVV